MNFKNFASLNKKKPYQTWCLSIVVKIWNQQRLRIDDHYVVRADVVHSTQLSDFGWPRKIQVIPNDHITKVDTKVIAPNREPPDVPQSFALRQRQSDVFVAILSQHTGTTTFIPQAMSSLVARCTSVSHVEVRSLELIQKRCRLEFTLVGTLKYLPGPSPS